MNTEEEIIAQLERFSKYRGFGKFIGFSFIMFVLIFFGGITINLWDMLFQASSYSYYINLFLGFGVFIILICIIIGLIADFVLSNKLNSLKECNKKLGDVDKNIEQIDEIAEVCNHIFDIICELIQLRYFIELIYPGKMRTYKKVFSMQYSRIIPILTDLRSDFQIHLTQQQKILESAKSEVEENIQGTSELEQVSELQKARLDRQIEQFEELQKVLIKI